MQIDDNFLEAVRRELETRINNGTLPGTMQRALAKCCAGLWHSHSASMSSGVDDIETSTSQFVLRSVVNAFGSPSLLIRNGAFETPASATWDAILAPHRSEIQDAIPAVGRIEVDHHPRLAWVGTGVLVAPDVLVTNRHVALDMAAADANGWHFSTGLLGRTIEAKVDFLAEDGVAQSAEFALTDVLAVENQGGPDLAFLRVETQPGAPSFLGLGAAAAKNQAVATIGYTAKEPGMPPELQEILDEIFGTVYDVKRLAPGRILRLGAGSLAHDCSTLRGNSGSALIDIETGLLVGIHFAGDITENLAVSAEVVQAALDALP